MIHVESLSTLTAGMERLNPGVFFRNVCCWRAADISPSKFKEFPSREVLPLRSVVHILDNFKNLEEGIPITDIPNLDHPFLNNETGRKAIWHQTRPQTEGMITTSNDYIFRDMRLAMNLNKFRSTIAGKYLVKMQLSEFNTADNFIGVVNHNPIFRLFVRGIMVNWRSTEHFLASIFNTVEAVPDRLHFFVIPLATKIFVKGKYMALSMRVSPSSVVDKRSYQYCLFGQLYNYLNANCNIPTIFDSIRKEYLDKIILTFECGGHYLFWPIATLKALNENNRVYPRLFNHFNGFILRTLEEMEMSASTSSGDVITVDEKDSEQEVESKIVKHYSDIKKIPVGIIQSKSDIEAVKKSDLVEKSSDIEEIDSKARIIENVTFKLDNKVTEVDYTDIGDVVEKNTSDTEDKSSESTEAEEPGDAVWRRMVTGKTPVENDDVVYYTPDTDMNAVRLPNQMDGTFTTKEDMVKVGKEYLDNLDEHIARNIAKDQSLTKAQKERALNMAKAYKFVSVGGKTVEEHFLEPVDPGSALTDVKNISEEKMPDRSMTKSSIVKMDEVYMKKLYYRHLAGMAVSMAPQGMYLQGISEEAETNELSQVKHFKFTYKTVQGKTHSISFSHPVIRSDGTFMVNGVRSSMAKQLVTKPIAKISPTRVSLVSYYNKTIVERAMSQAHDYVRYISDYINKIVEEAPKCVSDIAYEVRTMPERSTVAAEYWQLCQKYHSVRLNHHQSGAISFLYFGKPEDRAKYVKYSDAVWKKIEHIENSRQWTFVGSREGNAKYSPGAYYMDISGRLHLVGEQHGKDFHEVSTLTNLFYDASGVQPKKDHSEWTTIKILDAKFPVGFLLCYRYGLFGLMRKLGIRPEVLGRSEMRQLKSDVRNSLNGATIPFADGKYLRIPRYPLKTSLILQGLIPYNTKSIPIEEFDHRDVYYQLLLDKNMKAGRTNYLIGIDDTFEMFIDPITFERLKQMHEPTDFGSLLVRATEMLVTAYHRPASGMANHCIRSYERMNGILYNEMSAQMRQYRKTRGTNVSYSMNPNSVMTRIRQDPTVMPVEDINPLHDIKMTTKLSYFGIGGRQAESFTVDDRCFPPDALGIVSESTPSAGGVGVITQSSMNPRISNIYGLVEDDIEIDKLEPTEMLSAVALYMPAVTQDDTKRMVFAANFASHAIPTKEGTCSRLRTGYEYMIPHQCGDIYAYAAKEDGVVVDVNEDIGMMRIQYLDGTVESLSTRTQFGQCSDMVVEHQQAITVKKGDKFKKGEILRYNPQYFEPDPDMKRQVAYKHGYIGRVALVENNYTFEDSNGISKSLSSKLEIRPVITKMITIPTTVVIHKFAKVGDLVEHNTPLVTFELADTTDISGIGVDDSAMEYLESLNRTSPKAKTSGEIVSIQVLYASDLKDMSRTVRKMVDEYTKEKTAVGEYAEGSANNYLYPKSAQVPENSKYKGVNIDKETLILTYYIREAFDQNTGDKVVLDSSLKSVTCQVFEHAPVTESGKPIDVVFSVLCISKRIVNSPIISGMCETVLQTLEDKVLDIYFNGALTRGTNNHAAATSTEAFSVVPNEKNISVMSYFKSDEDKKLAVRWLKEFNEDDEADFDEKNAYPVGFYLKNKDMTETLIGYGLWNILAGYNNHPQILNFYIGSEYRDSGYGTIAYEKFLSFIKTKGYKYLTIGAKLDNRKANHIYAKHNGQLASKFSLFDLRRIPKKNFDKEEGIVKIVTLKCDSVEHKKYEAQLDKIRLEYMIDDGMAELKAGWKPVYLNESIIGLDKHGNALAYCGKSQSTIFNPIAFTAEDMEIFVSHIARVIYRNDYKYSYDDTANMCYNPGIIYPVKGRFASIFDKWSIPLTNIYLVKL